MIQAAILDDEPKAVENLAQLLVEHCPEVHLIAKLTEPRDARETLVNLNPDLLFLDIEMPHHNGFELLEQSIPSNMAVIFTTAYDKYALRAIKFAALDFLLKPIDAQELKMAVMRYRDSPKHTDLKERFNGVLETLEAKEPLRLAVPDQRGVSFVELEELVFLEADRNYTRLHLLDGSTMVSSRNLKEFEVLLRDLSFYRVHHSYLVNLKHVKRYSKNGFLHLTNHREIEVARRRKADLFRLLRLV